MSKRLKYLIFVVLFLIIFIKILNLFSDEISDATEKFNFMNKNDKFLIKLDDYDSDTVNSINDFGPNPNLLVNFTKFEFKIRNKICEIFESDDDEFIGIILVTSYVGHDEIRASHRQSISQEKLQKMGFLRVFLIAEIPEHEKFITQKAIMSEHNIFGDLVQGNFIENYKNLTLKHIMGMKWIMEMCFNAKYVIKIDDDTVYDIFHLQNYLMDLEHDPKDFLLSGFVLNGKKPIRLSQNKWYVKPEEYERDIYPDYLSGWFYITNVRTAEALVIQSQTTRYFWIDDTYVTGILAEKLKIKLNRLNDWYSANSQFIDCCIKDVIKSFLKCDYHVGPNGGDHKLIIKFTKAMEQCSDDFCADRMPQNSLRNTCVGSIKDILTQEHGDAFVKPVKL